MTTRKIGPVETAVRKSLRELRDGADSTVYEAYAAGCISLAQTLDQGAGMAAAAVHRELRTTLDALRPKEVQVDDELVSLLDRVQRVSAAAAPVGHNSN